MSPFLIISSPR